MRTLSTGFLKVGLLSAALLGFARPAAAVTITFDDAAAPCLFNQTAPLREAYSSLGVHFAGGGGILNDCSAFGVAAYSGDNFLAFNHALRYPDGTFASGMETITFDVPQQTVSLRASGGDTSAGFTLGAWTASGVFIGGDYQIAPVGGYALLSVTSAASDISRVVFATTLDVTYVADDLTFDTAAVPEPSSLLLLLAGGAAAGRRLRGLPRRRA